MSGWADEKVLPTLSSTRSCKVDQTCFDSSTDGLKVKKKGETLKTAGLSGLELNVIRISKVKFLNHEEKILSIHTVG